MPARLMAAKMDWTGCRLVDIQRVNHLRQPVPVSIDGNGGAKEMIKFLTCQRVSYSMKFTLPNSMLRITS